MIYKFFIIFFIFMAAGLSNIATYQWVKYQDEQAAIAHGFANYNLENFNFTWKSHYDVGKEVIKLQLENFRKQEEDNKKKFNTTPLNPPALKFF